MLTRPPAGEGHGLPGRGRTPWLLGAGVADAGHLCVLLRRQQGVGLDLEVAGGPEGRMGVWSGLYGMCRGRHGAEVRALTDLVSTEPSGPGWKVGIQQVFVK